MYSWKFVDLIQSPKRQRIYMRCGYSKFFTMSTKSNFSWWAVMPPTPLCRRLTTNLHPKWVNKLESCTKRAARTVSRSEPLSRGGNENNKFTAAADRTDIIGFSTRPGSSSRPLMEVIYIIACKICPLPAAKRSQHFGFNRLSTSWIPLLVYFKNNWCWTKFEWWYVVKALIASSRWSGAMGAIYNVSYAINCKKNSLIN